VLAVQARRIPKQLFSNFQEVPVLLFGGSHSVVTSIGSPKSILLRKRVQRAAARLISQAASSTGRHSRRNAGWHDVFCVGEVRKRRIAQVGPAQQSHAKSESVGCLNGSM
jgi:hypothetical protein